MHMFVLFTRNLYCCVQRDNALCVKPKRVAAG